MRGRLSKAETYKCSCAAKLLKKLRNCGKSFYNIVEMIEQMMPEIAGFYVSDCEECVDETLRRQAGSVPKGE